MTADCISHAATTIQCIRSIVLGWQRWCSALRKTFKKVSCKQNLTRIRERSPVLETFCWGNTYFSPVTQNNFSKKWGSKSCSRPPLPKVGGQLTPRPPRIAATVFTSLVSCFIGSVCYIKLAVFCQFSLFNLKRTLKILKSSSSYRIEIPVIEIWYRVITSC